MDLTSEEVVLREGWLRKKGSRVNVWGERFFVLKGNTLFYYVKSIDSVGTNTAKNISSQTSNLFVAFCIRNRKENLS